ncbi:hypothetical protein [Streptomyces sp. NPDC002580]|uniref:hypothetical protein n=1 Tax=Streptomyces sp. NPDC002580 TaxID=3364653 RepID=UPI0036C6EE18
MNHGPDEQPDTQGTDGPGPEGLGSDEHPETLGTDGPGPGRPGSDEHPDTLGTDQPGPEGPGSDVRPDILGLGGPGLDGLGSDELALRRLLQQAVEEIEPTDGTLDHLRRAVPARRARKRQAVVGMAAAALFVGMAIPAFVHVSNSSGANANPSNAANQTDVQGGENEGKANGGGKNAGDSNGTSKGQGEDGKKHSSGGKDTGASGAATGGAGPSASAPAATACTSAQLGGASGAAAGPDSTGTVYGSFTVSNVSTTVCTVTGAGTVGTLAQGAADAGRIGVATHVAGDAAAGLPDPSAEVTSLVLQPGTSYVVKFAWVPSATCPTVEPTPDPTPTEGATDTGGTAGETGGGSSVATQLLRTDGVQPGSVVISSTAATGGASASVTVPDACAGTVYHTGILAS